MKDHQSRSVKFPLIIAHRGANSFAPENSLAAFEQAIRLGCDGIEMDLRFTAYGEVIVFHDRNLNRMTGRRGRIHQLTLTEIKDYHLEGNPEYYIPTLQEAIDLIGKNCLIILDVKKKFLRPNGFEEKIIQILQDFNLRENIIISSYSPLVLKRIYQISPEYHLGYIFRNRSQVFMSNGVSLKSMHAYHHTLSRRYVKSLKERGFSVFAWTVDSEKDMLRVMEKEVDGLMTNKPEVFYHHIKKTSGS